MDLTAGCYATNLTKKFQSLDCSTANLKKNEVVSPETIYFFHKERCNFAKATQPLVIQGEVNAAHCCTVVVQLYGHIHEEV